MKKILAAILLTTAFSLTGGQSFATLSNGEVGVVVNKATGQFAIGDMTMRPVIDGYPNDPSHTHFCVTVDGEVFSNVPSLSVSPMVIMDSAQVIENTISMVWSIGENRVWEKFYTLDEDSIRKFIYIEYVFYNANPSTSATVGFLQYADIKIDDNDNPTVVIPGEIFHGTEREFAAENMPAYWTFFSNYGDSNSFLGQGVPFGRDEIYADFLVFSDVANLDSVHWNYTTSSQPVDDLAMIIRWDEQTVEAYDFYIVGYYYGLGYPDAEIREIAQKLVPTKLVIGSPYPNPTNGGASVKISVLDNPQKVRVEVVDLTGKRVKTLHSGVMQPGKHVVRWDLTDDSGKMVDSGVYLLKISYSLTGVITRKITVVR